MSDAKLVDPRRNSAEVFTWTGVLFVILPVMLVVIGLGGTSWWLWGYLLGVNLSTLLLHAYDKLSAVKNLLRVPKSTLDSFTLVGGTPATLLARHWQWNQASKQPLKWTFWVMVGLQVFVLLLVWYFLT